MSNEKIAKIRLSQFANELLQEAEDVVNWREQFKMSTDADDKRMIVDSYSNACDRLRKVITKINGDNHDIN